MLEGLWVLIALLPSVDDRITVFAASSTADLMAELAAAHDPDGIALSFAASTTLARQIKEGAPADIFVSADPALIDTLAAQGLVQERAILAENRLVMIVPAEEPVTAFDPERFEGRIAIGDPAFVPAGRYAYRALISQGWWSPLEDRMILCENVRTASRLVALGEADLGIVYLTDALAERNVNVIHTFSENDHPAIVLPVALLADHRPEALDFFRFMTSSMAREILERHGFQAPGQSRDTPEPMVGTPAASLENALIVSTRVAFLCLLWTLVPGIAIAWVLARFQFPGKSLFEALVYAPLVLPPVITGYLLLLVFGRKGLVGGFLETTLGVSLSFNLTAAVIAAGVMSFPLLVRAARLGFEMVDPGLETAAATLGARPATIFFRITLPLALPGILTGLMLAFARSLGEFGATIVFAGNIEGETRSIPLAVYTLMQQPGEERGVFLLSMLSIGLSLLALVFSDRGARFLQTRLRGRT